LAKWQAARGDTVVARKVQVEMLDDIDGSPAEETVTFGLDGASYEIDLSANHAEKLQASLAEFILSSRRLGRGRVNATRRARTGGPAPVDRSQNQAIRDWAKSKGLDVSDRGRIPAQIINQYQAEAGRR
jgi:hypothetical protein